ncbi:hypothetical protein [Nonomuraea sp. NPDC049695]|uniref:hypothetical protein n=1 Tax=Nonomuraea sp. NPDC049695 TaxID=3154734 RepID=UPI0034382A98
MPTLSARDNIAPAALPQKALLLDEPTRGVDVATKLEMQALLDGLAVDGLTILLISSDVSEPDE